MESREYQQLMYDLLGNRDYDNFENDELDSLKRKIGYALYGHPQNEDGYDTKQNNLIDKLFDIILKQSDKFSKHKNRVVISFVYNCTEPLEHEKKKRDSKYTDYNPKTDVQPYPVFILRKCKYSPTSCRVVIDHLGRVYQSWEEYLWRNTLPKCVMIFPKNGRYDGDQNGEVILDMKMSPSCGVPAKVLATTDVASTSIGLASAGIAIAASLPAVTLVGPLALCGAGMAGIGVGIYSIGRSLGTLYDKKRHKQSLSFSDSQARAAYMNIICGAMGFVGAGANVAVSQLASRGVNIGKEASLLVNTIGAANIGTSGLAILNSGYDVLEPWLVEKKTPSLLTLVQLSSSVLFFGHAVYNYKSTNRIVEETQTKVLEDIRKNLKHNKNKKAFEKFRMETIERNKGEIQKGHAEVIATMRKITDENQLFDILSNTNEDLEDLGYAAKNGELLTFNGVPVHLGKISGSSSKGELENFFSISRTSENITPSNICDIKDNLKKSFGILQLDGGGVSKLSNYFVGLMGSASSIAGPILSLINEFILGYLIKDKNILRALNELFPKSDEKCIQIINSVTGFVYEEAKKIENIFKSSEATENKLLISIFHQVIENGLDENNRLKCFMKFVCDMYNDEGNISQDGLNQLKQYFAHLVTQQTFLYREKRERKMNRKKIEKKVERIKCPQCFGLRYAIIQDAERKK